VTNLLTALRSAISRLRPSKLKAGWTSRRPALEQRSLSPEERVRRGEMAQELLRNSLLNEAIISIEADLLAQMYAVKLDDVNSHTRLILALQTNRAVSRHLWNRIQDGVAASQEIQLRGRRID
jgi:hypothetical protein